MHISTLLSNRAKYNYRCSKKILNAANYICTEIRRDFAKKAILKEYKNPAAIQLIPSPVAINGVVRVIPSNFEGFLNGNNGVTAVVREILSTNKDTTINNNNGSSDDEKIFILSRDNARCGEIHKKLKEDSFIKVTNKSIMLPKYGSLFTSQPANDLLALLKYREKRTDINNAINLINSGFGFFDQEITSEVIINIAREDKNKIFKIADIIYEASEEIISKQENVVTNIKMLFESLPNKYINNNDYISNIKLILNELSILAKDKTGNFGNVINFINYNAVKREIKTKEEREFNSQIIILTQHSAKGLERANVIAYIDQYINFEYKQLTYGKNEDNKRTKTKIDIIFTGDLVDGDVKSNKFDFSLERLNPKGEYCSVYTKNFTNSFRSRAETQFFEEVNLLYITMTRAKKTLTLYVNNSKNNLGEYIWRLYSRNLK